MVISLFETWCLQKLMHFWNLVFTFAFVKWCDAYITHAAIDKPYRADHRETVPLICNAQYIIKILVPIEKKMQKIWFRHVLDNLWLKIFFVVQPWWLTCFMLHLPRNLGPHLRGAYDKVNGFLCSYYIVKLFVSGIWSVSTKGFIIDPLLFNKFI